MLWRNKALRCFSSRRTRPRGEEGRLLMENTPVEPGPASLGPTGQQAETIGVDQLYRQQLRQIGQALGLGTGDLELGFAPLSLASPMGT